ncbi:MAG: hypothetical protein UW41_C0006G0035 [Candidatus Collierbacteria bacterium GW2011_GWC2_44_18]|uniref:Uncharacterized protein n=1 Tax=Candidatus Collierbacteria bacterium GW2011_GWC2_44_18 TaxID=1618392 RepID=A0A0G1JZZ3_9BACT|nr:MAG: hypothetical protein UW41_C0006G0035 [Candidatus Collierbacteria bacterium GW2011_GWC2_44_18]
MTKNRFGTFDDIEISTLLAGLCLLLENHAETRRLFDKDFICRADKLIALGRELAVVYKEIYDEQD